MELKIFWTEFSKSELTKIFDYYKENATVAAARKLVSGIVTETKLLTNHPEIGGLDDLLTDYPETYRHIIYKNYKIVYTINLAKAIVEIHDIFDTRQNPVKITRKK